MKMNVTAREKPVIGIIGGAGPDAAIYFQSLLYSSMKYLLSAKKDHEHLRTFIDNNIYVNAFESNCRGGAFYPTQYLSSIKLMNAIGVKLIVIPCNSAHLYFEIMTENFPNIPILNMIEITCEFLKREVSSKAVIGIAGINSSISTKLYEPYLTKCDFSVVLPEQKFQDYLTAAINEIKAGNYRTINPDMIDVSFLNNNQNNQFNSKKFNLNFFSPSQILSAVCKHLIDKGADRIVLGCSELSMIANQLNKSAINQIIVDPLPILAEQAIFNVS